MYLENYIGIYQELVLPKFDVDFSSLEADAVFWIEKAEEKLSGNLKKSVSYEQAILNAIEKIGALSVFVTTLGSQEKKNKFEQIEVKYLSLVKHYKNIILKSFLVEIHAGLKHNYNEWERFVLGVVAHPSDYEIFDCIEMCLSRNFVAQFLPLIKNFDGIQDKLISIDKLYIQNTRECDGILEPQAMEAYPKETFWWYYRKLNNIDFFE